MVRNIWIAVAGDISGRPVTGGVISLAACEPEAGKIRHRDNHKRAGAVHIADEITPDRNKTKGDPEERDSGAKIPAGDKKISEGRGRIDLEPRIFKKR